MASTVFFVSFQRQTPCLMQGCPGVGVALAQPYAVLDSPLPHSLCGEELLAGSEEVGSITLGQYLRQLAHHRNFLWFVGMDLVQVWEQSPHPGGLGYGNTILKN